MKADNERHRSALTALTAALFHLDDLDCTITSARTGRRNPVIEIEPPKPSSAQWLNAGVHSRVAINGQRTITYAARVRGVEVRWVERESTLPLAVGAEL